MKEETRYFIEECKQEQEWKERWKSNHIEFDDYFKYIQSWQSLSHLWVLFFCKYF